MRTLGVFEGNPKWGARDTKTSHGQKQLGLPKQHGNLESSSGWGVLFKLPDPSRKDHRRFGLPFGTTICLREGNMGLPKKRLSLKFRRGIRKDIAAKSPFRTSDSSSSLTETLHSSKCSNPNNLKKRVHTPYQYLRHVTQRKALMCRRFKDYAIGLPGRTNKSNRLPAKPNRYPHPQRPKESGALTAFCKSGPAFQSAPDIVPLFTGSVFFVRVPLLCFSGGHFPILSRDPSFQKTSRIQGESVQ